MNISSGYGTYISAGILFAATVAHYFKWIDDATFNALMGVAGTGGLTFLRAAQSNSDTKNAIANGILAKSMDVKPTIVTSIVDQSAISPVSVKTAPVK